MAYRAEIQIGVVGVGQIGALQKSLNQVANTVDILNKKRIDAGFNVQNINTYNAQLERAVQNVNKAALGSKEELRAVTDLVRAKQNQIAAQERLNQLIAKEEASQRRIVATADAGFGVQGPKPAKKPGGRTPGQLFENLALGAGFPLLFGGGPGQVLGGLAGSFVGTGFGGQILGSALGGQLEQLGIAAAQAGQALQKPIDNFGVIEQRAILASSSQERYIKQLIDGGQFIEATAAIQKRYNDVVGAQGSANLLELAQSSDELNRAWSELNLQLQAALAGPLADLVNWVAGLVQAGADANREAKTQSEIFAALSPEQQKQFKAQEAEILKGANIFNEAEKRRQVAELARGFGGAGQAQAPVESFKAAEVQDTASIERRREIQAQITQLRQAELAAAQAQLQQDITILTKQQEFATSLNQQSAIIDAIAAKKVESANLEYQQVQRTQQTEIINKQLALESAQAKALAAQEEIKQLDAAKKLTPERQAELSAVIERVTVAEKDLATTKAIANTVTQRAAKERESAAALGELERKQQNVAAFAADAARQTEAFSRASAEANNALDNRLRVSDALTQAAIAVNSVELQSLQTKLTQAQTEGQRLDIINSIKDLEIENAQLTLIASRQQIAAEVERQRTALANAEVKFRELQAVVELARAQGVLNQAYIDALNAQRSALVIAQNNFQTSIQVANAQNAAADATFRAAVNAANFKAQLEGSAVAAGAIAGSLERAAAATGAGRPSALSFFGEAGRNPLFAAEFQRRVDELNQQASTFTTASRAYNDLVIEFTERARQFNEQVAAERLAGAAEDFIERTGDTNLGLTLFRNAINAGADSAIRLDIAQAEAARALEERYRLRNSMDASAGNTSGVFVSNQQNTGGGSSFTPQVNITTGPVMQMGNETFVTQGQLASATQQAAQQGANLALQNLQNSPSLRRNAGLTR